MNKINIKIFLSAFLLVAVMVACYSYKKHVDREKLNQLYREGLVEVYDKNNDFSSAARLAYLNSLLAAGTVSGNMTDKVNFFRAVSFLELGEENKAIEILAPLTEKLKSDQQNSLYKDVISYLAIAYLRLGERNNCITGHSSGSCIFPIQGNGVYADTAASRKGIAVYREILEQDSSDLESRWLMNIAYMTIGEYPQSVPSAWLIPNLDSDSSSYKVKAFQDMSGTLRLSSFKNMAGGSIVDDFNKDGYLDIVTSSWGLDQSMHYFKNNADGTFTDVSASSGLSNIKGGLNIIQADYNNDGYVDILVLRGAWLGEFGRQPNSLLRNNGDGTFTDVTVESGLLSFHPTQTATWADFNNDGWLDLFIGNETSSPDHPHPSELYMNNRDGSFTNVADQAGCAFTGFMKGVVSADYNNDGWPDIFISRLDGRKMLLKNKGLHTEIPEFEDVTHDAGLDMDITNTFPTWFWDYDNDGWPDIFVCGYKFQGSLAKVAAAEALHRSTKNVSSMYLYRNNHDGTFTNVSKEMGLDHPVFAMGSNFGDIDNDGWLDMYLGTGNPDYRSLVPNRLFKNIGGKKFVDVTRSARVGNLQKGHGVAFADVDNDGDQDIFLETGGAFKGDAYFNSLYVNPGQGDNHWIAVQLEGVQSNRSAIGAHIAVRFTDGGEKRTVYMDVNSGGSFGGSPLRKEIGIGRASVIDELIIKWPTSGTVQVFKNIAPCQFLRIREGSKQPEKMDLRKLLLNDGRAAINLLDCAPVKR